ncbi:ABC transporter permease, partial [Enterococcus faecium]
MRTGLPIRIIAGLLLVFLPAPLVIVIGASFSPGSVLQFPPPGFSLRWYEAVLGNHEWVMAFVAS